MSASSVVLLKRTEVDLAYEWSVHLRLSQSQPTSTHSKPLTTHSNQSRPTGLLCSRHMTTHVNPQTATHSTANCAFEPSKPLILKTPAPQTHPNKSQEMTNKSQESP